MMQSKIQLTEEEYENQKRLSKIELLKEVLQDTLEATEKEEVLDRVKGLLEELQKEQAEAEERKEQERLNPRRTSYSAAIFTTSNKQSHTHEDGTKCDRWSACKHCSELYLWHKKV